MVKWINHVADLTLEIEILINLWVETLYFAVLGEGPKSAEIGRWCGFPRHTLRCEFVRTGRARYLSTTRLCLNTGTERLCLNRGGADLMAWNIFGRVENYKKLSTRHPKKILSRAGTTSQKCRTTHLRVCGSLKINSLKLIKKYCR